LPADARGENFCALSRNRPSPARSTAASRRCATRRAEARARVVRVVAARVRRDAHSRADPVFTVLFFFAVRAARARIASMPVRIGDARGAARNFAPKKIRQNG
jgi:hypothetical protein